MGRLVVGRLTGLWRRCTCVEEFIHGVMFAGLLFIDKLTAVVEWLYEHLFVRKQKRWLINLFQKYHCIVDTPVEESNNIWRINNISAYVRYLYSAGNWTFWNINQNYLESSEMWNVSPIFISGVSTQTLDVFLFSTNHAAHPTCFILIVHADIWRGEQIKLSRRFLPFFHYLLAGWLEFVVKSTSWRCHLLLHFSCLQ